KIKLPGTDLNFEVENIVAPEKGVYHVNIGSLMKKETAVARDEEGVYHINFRNPKKSAQKIGAGNFFE
ncbi:MAG: hypothetical protein AB1468_06695, partial [Candidatus Micrarchaeota archaeon]